tara:strand:+ start:708 stop:1553 length:846 start_codon:yes stop_codon:yes gene_type:complete
MNKYQESIDANIAVHSTMANTYNQQEPHYRPESISRVENIVSKICKQHKVKDVLDLGCGTGFMIDILKNYVETITGVDVTQDMLDLVDQSGPAKINLINSDTGSIDLPSNHFDLATAYTFLDHLYDMIPTFENTYKALKEGGVFYADLSPNFYFWDAFKNLNPSNSYDSVVDRELKAVLEKDKEIEKEFGLSAEVFAKAEHQKHIKGGLIEEEMRNKLLNTGFKKVDFVYHWFVGQAEMINNKNLDKKTSLLNAQMIHDSLIRCLPVSRNLFKYVGFIAYK